MPFVLSGITVGFAVYVVAFQPYRSLMDQVIAAVLAAMQAAVFLSAAVAVNVDAQAATDVAVRAAEAMELSALGAPVLLAAGALVESRRSCRRAEQQKRNDHLAAGKTTKDSERGILDGTPLLVAPASGRVQIASSSNTSSFVAAARSAASAPARSPARPSNNPLMGLNGAPSG